jgi:hypothetical protein
MLQPLRGGRTPMNDHRRGLTVPFDEGKLQLVRTFLRREFQDCRHRDYFAFDKTAQVFLIETEQQSRYALVIPKSTFDHRHFSRLLNSQLVTALRHAGSRGVTLVPQGAPTLAREVTASERRRPLERLLAWGRVTDAFRAAPGRRLAYGAAMLLLGIGVCALVSLLGLEVHSGGDVGGPRLAADRIDTAVPAPPPRAVSPSGGPATVERPRGQERPAGTARRAVSTRRPAERSSDTRPPTDTVARLKRLVVDAPQAHLGKVVRWVKDHPAPRAASRGRGPEIPQSL